MSLQSSMPPLQQGALQQAQAAAQRAQAAAVQRARDTLDLCTMYSLQAQAAAPQQLRASGRQRAAILTRCPRCSLG